MTRETGGHALVILVLVAAANGALAGEPVRKTQLERLLANDEKILTVQCEIRRDTKVGGKTLRTLSRVWFKRPNLLRVETVTPEVRRIVSDGTAIYKWIEGQKAGVRTPLSEAGEWDLLQVRRVPATAQEYWLRLSGLPETRLPPADGFPVRRAYNPSAPHPHTELGLDEMGRLARLEYFDRTDRSNQVLRADFDGWVEAKPGIWIACLQKIESKARDGTEVRETLRVSALEVNEPIDAGQFDATRWMRGVRFVTPREMKESLENR